MHSSIGAFNYCVKLAARIRGFQMIFSGKLRSYEHALASFEHGASEIVREIGGDFVFRRLLGCRETARFITFFVFTH